MGTIMIKIVDLEKIDSISVLFLDSDLPRAGWNKVVIDGIKYAPIPVYDMEKVVAVVGDGFYCGQEVEFLYEV